MQRRLEIWVARLWPEKKSVVIPKMQHKGKRLFITGIPTAGKSYLAKRLAEEVGGVAVCLDDFREGLVEDEKYRKWVNFYLDQDEKSYLTESSPDVQWNNLVRQSEALWPVFIEKMFSYAEEQRPVIFECVNILPHLARRDLDFPGIVLLGSSYEEVLKRNVEDPRWGNTRDLQELEAKTFWEIERPRYKTEAERCRYPTYRSPEEAYTSGIQMLEGSYDFMRWRTTMPRIIKDVGFDFSWDSKKVWALSEPVVEMDINELVWHFDIPFWEVKDANDYSLAPWNVIKEPQNEAHSEHWKKIEAADLKYPIDIMENKGRWLILDGLHRLVKAYTQGQKVVQVRKIPRSRISEILK